MAAEPDAGMMSSSSISSPPTSPHHSNDTIRVSHSSNSLPRNLYEGVVAAAVPASSPQPSLPAPNTPAHATAPNTASAGTTTTANNPSAPEKPKRQRKKKEEQLGPDGKPVVDEKPKKPRKPREPKEKTVGNGAPPPRKKVKTEPKADDKAANDVATPPRQPTLTGMLGGFQPSSKPAPAPAAAPSALAPPASTQHLRVSEPSTHHSTTQNMSTPPPSRPISSGQNYDPIRGSTLATRMSNPPNGAQTLQSTAFVNRASASPSIASLIDPPMAPLILSPPQAATQRPHAPLPQQSSPPPKDGLAAPLPSNSASKPDSALTNVGDTVDMEPSVNVPGRQIPDIKTPSKSSSSAGPAPKAARRSPEPLKGTGSGLLSTSDLFGGGASSDPLERKGVNIDLHITLNPKGGNNINIAQEIIKKYGREAMNPRAAAHREQLLRIAAEQDRLAGTSNDEMSVDLLSDMEGDSNAEMGGMDDEKSNTGIDGDKPKKRKKREDYDKEDDFIDDTELAWQEQAAVAKDGFFVYSGPLIPEGQQAQIESSAPTRGGRGRGRGSRGGRTANAGTTHASLADKSRDTTTTTTTTPARGRGSRGGRGTGAPRRPRGSKAEKEKMASASATGSVSVTPAPTTQSALHQTSTATTPQAPQSSPPAQVVGGVA
ncbi:hypothetical protein BDY17DRAFT_311581 [Neohortaea acidophila]|uniref:Hpc2-related domain-containing protein n=1 Tax=Neohortaea acidophila TaxID=245834 RepID=A0A6A6PPD7_9PEZI|nr:uncharacterized protein BDY17DRAFT_311581 [Neohortaea acidophila]KAF2481970.1 hypothetical protein BDY17DRAFT_311581 [Neohortaea acidophila]